MARRKGVLSDEYIKKMCDYQHLDFNSIQPIEVKAFQGKPVTQYTQLVRGDVDTAVNLSTPDVQPNRILNLLRNQRAFHHENPQAQEPLRGIDAQEPPVVLGEVVDPNEIQPQRQYRGLLRMLNQAIERRDNRQIREVLDGIINQVEDENARVAIGRVDAPLQIGENPQAAQAEIVRNMVDDMIANVVNQYPEPQDRVPIGRVDAPLQVRENPQEEIVRNMVDDMFANVVNQYPEGPEEPQGPQEAQDPRNIIRALVREGLDPRAIIRALARINEPQGGIDGDVQTEQEVRAVLDDVINQVAVDEPLQFQENRAQRQAQFLDVPRDEPIINPQAGAQLLMEQMPNYGGPRYDLRRPIPLNLFWPLVQARIRELQGDRFDRRMVDREFIRHSLENYLRIVREGHLINYMDFENYIINTEIPRHEAHIFQARQEEQDLMRQARQEERDLMRQMRREMRREDPPEYNAPAPPQEYVRP